MNIFRCLRTCTQTLHQVEPHTRIVQLLTNLLKRDSTQLQQKCLDFQKNSASHNQLQEIHEFLRLGRIGFLKGDVNPFVLYKMKDFIQKNKSSLDREYYQRLFDQVTERYLLRLPRMGITEADEEDLENLMHRQVALQNESFINANQEHNQLLQQMNKISKLHELGIASKYTTKWFPRLVYAITNEKNQLNGLKNDRIIGDRNLFGPQLLKISSDKAAAVCLSVLMRHIMANLFENNPNKQVGEFSLNDALKEMAMQLHMQIEYEQKQKEIRTRLKRQKKETDKNINYAKLKEELVKVNQEIKMTYQNIGNKYGNILNFSSLLKLASFLIYLSKSLILVENQLGMTVPLLTLEYRTQIKQTKKISYTYQRPYLVIQHHFIQKMQKEMIENKSNIIHIEKALPMISMPAQWNDSRIGGYYNHSTLIMRFSKGEEQERTLIHQYDKRVYSILDGLGKQTWRINQPVLKIIKEVWDEGGNKCEVPQRYDQPNKVTVQDLKRELNYKKKHDLNKQLQHARDQHSLRCSFLLRLHIADTMKDISKIYFPHNMDFRGRVYPIPPHMNHMGSDLSRGLLQFSEGVRIGKEGLTWLKIQFANVWGKEKAPFHQKLKFVEESYDLIRAVALEPTRHRQWMDNQDCWQSLAACFELNSALQQPNPQDFLSRLHVHQDGSCNGLQHYAALGRDFQGGKQVNLVPGDRPGDVYTHVAKLVDKKIDDILNGPNDNKDYEMAAKVKGHVKRKTIKQTVMTSVYGVTFVGAREQIGRQLKDQSFLADDQLYKASVFLAKLTMESIKDLFDCAHDIKKWFIELAAISARCGLPMSWITPLGLPVIQPYRIQREQESVKTVTGSIMIQSEHDHLPIDVPRQKSAFPPNFVHSLDSTHMMMTAEKCFAEGISFAAVHDSYWTHAAHVNRMNQLLREQFVYLHGLPLLEQLQQSMKDRFPEMHIRDPPNKGKLDLKEILNSKYFFS